MTDELTVYREWNRALWNYFFPKGTEDAILYLDDGIIEQIALESNFNLTYGKKDWSDFFLSSTLLKGNHFEYFLNQLRAVPQLSDPRPRPRTWDKLVLFLTTGKISNTPAYFAMLCSILYMAAKCGSTHEEMRGGAYKYLGDDYRGKFGELVDPLLQQLHADVPSFNQNRMICGTQRHMSRIKFHLVLRRSMRDDFIDFVEINNLKWDWEDTSYPFYIDNLLVPALDSARKHDLAQMVTKQENIPYFKSILQSGLEFGRTVSKFGNTVQEKDIRWKYQLYFDYNGNYHFYIVTDYVLPFGIELTGERFSIINDGAYSDYVASDVPLKGLEETKFSFGGLNYSFSNVSCGQHDYGTVFLFEAVSEDTYMQVEIPVEGKAYYAFVNEKLGRVPTGWNMISNSPVDGYKLYQIDSFSGRQRSFTSSRIKLEDTFCRQNLGSWYSIKLEEGQELYWIPNEVGGQENAIVESYVNSSGITFFHISSKNAAHLSGTLLVKKKGKEVLSEPVSAHFEWQGSQSLYHMNGWGEIVPGALPEPGHNHLPLRRAVIQSPDQSSSVAPEMLLQLIYDSADDKGRITKRKLDAAIGFALSYYGIILTRDNSRSIIYGLRRLGYVIKYEQDNQELYQLTAPFLEKTNYSISSVLNAFLVKGTYSQLMLSNLLSSPGIIRTKRIRPYGQDTFNDHPEYACLPDQILIEATGQLPWKTLECPIAEQVLNSMEDIRGFANKYGIGAGGDIYRGVPPTVLPGMVKNSQGFEVLCTKQNGNYVVHPYYTRDGRICPIPKHLARLYSQVQRKVPVCIMANTMSRDVNYGCISFVNNMGVPELLDIALCDLNLVMPSYEKVFIVNQQALGTSSSKPWTERRTYETHAMTSEHSAFLTWLSKIAGKKISDIKQEPNAVFVTRTRRDYKLILTKNFANHKHLLALYDGDCLTAFSLGQDVYLCETQTGLFKRINGDDVNSLLSLIISNNRQTLTLGEPYKASIEVIKNCNGIVVPILERVTF